MSVSNSLYLITIGLQGQRTHVMHLQHQSLNKSRKCLSNSNAKRPQKVMDSGQSITSTTLSIESIHMRHCLKKALTIIKVSDHPGHAVFSLLPSGSGYRTLVIHYQVRFRFPGARPFGKLSNGNKFQGNFVLPQPYFKKVEVMGKE